MKLTEDLDFINDIENKFPVNNWAIDGVHIWPTLRTFLFLGSSQFINSKNDSAKESQALKLMKKIRRIASGTFACGFAYIRDYQNNALLDEPVEAIFLVNSLSRNLVNEKWIDIFSDPIIESLSAINISSLSIETAPSGKYLIPRHHSSIFIQPLLDWILLKSRIVSTLKLFFSSYSEDLYNCKELESCLRYIEIEKGFSSQSILSIILSSTYSINSYARLFEKIFLKTTPKICFVVNYYSYEAMGMILACKKLGIVSVDIQHGVQGSSHGAYARWCSVPVNGYNSLPDFFWCWSEYECDTIKKWSASVFPHHQPIVCGNNWLNMWQDKQSPIVRVYHQKVKEFISSKGAEITILVSLQPLISLIEIVPEWVMAAIKSSPSSWLWLIRLHSGMINQKAEIEKLFQDHNCNNIEIDFATIIPLPALLTHADCHVTQHSSVVIEADRLNVPSVITHSLGVELFAEYIVNGSAVSVGTTTELTIAIERYLDKSPATSIKYQELDRLDFGTILTKLNYRR